MNLLCILFAAVLQVIPAGDAFVSQRQQRDSILIADQLEYGVEVKEVPEGSAFYLPDYSKVFNDTLVLVRNWQADTLSKKGRIESIRFSLLIAPFEEGHYQLPDISLLRHTTDGNTDTLLYKGAEIDVTTMPVDTATFVAHDLKGQMTYPVTFKEVLPWLLGSLGVAALVAAIVFAVLRWRRKRSSQAGPAEPPYLTALRGLEKYRGEKYWADDKQKAYYSGITDILRAYMATRFDIDAKEMTTAEIFSALKGNADLTPELYGNTRSLFELADYVKFAKHIASREENAAALPVAVGFITSTYQSQLDKEAAEASETKEAAR